MKKVSYRVVFNRKNQLNKDGKGLIQIECYLNGKRRYISTGIKIEPIYWNSKSNVIKNNHSKNTELNRLISQQIRNIEDFEFKQIQKKGIFSLNEINGFSHKSFSDSKFFLEFIENSMKINSALQKETIRQHKGVLTKLHEFNANVIFDEVDYNFVVKFDNFLIKKGLHINTIANHHKVLKRYINQATKEKLYNPANYPYKLFKVRKIQTKRTFLTMQEVDAIAKIKFTDATKHIEYVRDMFLFSCYTGLRFSDMQNLTNKDLIKVNNEYSIDIRMKKTKDFIKLPLSLLFNGKAVDVLKKYEEDFPDKFLFPRISNQKANQKLKVVAIISKINKNLTFHVSRHTFGTNLAIATSDQFLIKELMGHTDIKTSMIYIHTSQEQIRNKLKNTKWE